GNLYSTDAAKYVTTAEVTDGSLDLVIKKGDKSYGGYINGLDIVPVPTLPYHFDFGDGAVQSGWIAINSSTVYSPELGFGFDASSSQSGMDRAPGNIPSGYENLHKDQILGETTFKADVPNGKYEVVIYYGCWNTGFGVNYTLEGVSSGNLASTDAAQYKTEAEVTDGVLDLIIAKGSKSYGGYINGMDVIPLEADPVETAAPTVTPTTNPSVTPLPTTEPEITPTANPSATPIPTIEPSAAPTPDEPTPTPVIDDRAEAPKMNITSFIGGKKVELVTATSGADIRYTDDGSIPDASSKLYTDPINITDTITIKAIAIKSGMNNSNVTSGKITVSKVEKPKVSHAGGQYPVGTTITLKSATNGTTIYYTTDGSIPTIENGIKYPGYIVILKDMELKAIAVKDGYKTSDMLEEAYTVPAEVSGNTTVSAGSSTASAGDLVSVPLYVFTDSDISECSVVINYDADVFEYVSITPAEGILPLDISASSDNNGKVVIRYSGSTIESGEICSINLNALSSAEDGVYEITVEKSDMYDTVNGKITLMGSVNSKLGVSASAVLTDKSGKDIKDVSDMEGEITVGVFFEDAESNNDETPLTVNVMLAVYDRGGSLINLAMIEADTSDINRVLTHTIKIPENAEVGSIKMMIWNGLNDMAPLSESSSLL
ncbi:MAG: chitobiase/beta-hexosaminidase C-terminal domain-containing protein, partial [Oscillospiraceae bacterium]|nr:chitobiase/beta-hexosaminidase C-terminal domain-containing protein [Oscillospiraceae bacterium]